MGNFESAYQKIADFGRNLLKQPDIKEALPMIAEYSKDVIGVERCSIYMYNPRLHILWTAHSDGIEKIILQEDQGVAGYTIKQREPVIVNDPYHDERFMSLVDQKTGYKTKNIACVPIFDSLHLPIGVFQMLNKGGGQFDDRDVRFMTFFANFISGYLELSTLFEDESNQLKEGITRLMVHED